MATIKDQLNDALKQAMRAREQRTLNALRLLSAAVKQVEVDERIEVDDARMLVILDKLAKQRKESIAQYEKANRQDLVDQEQFELDIIIQYLPEPITEHELLKMVEQAIATTGASRIADMGKVMAILKSAVQGRADMAKVSAIIKSHLN